VSTEDPGRAEPEAVAAAPPAAGPLEPIADRVVVRRAPRYAAFIGAGLMIGVVLGLIFVLTGPAVPGGPRTAVLVFIAAGLASVGALVGAGFAVLADRRSDRRR
jgi:hypothetical protein